MIRIFSDMGVFLVCTQNGDAQTKSFWDRDNPAGRNQESSG